MLSESRVVSIGETPYAHEREAIDFARNNIPDNDPFHLWALLELLDPSTGRLHEIDLLVLGYSALYLIEIKSGPGVYEGDSVDWYRTPPGEQRSHYMDPPLKLANLKAKILKSRLQSKMKHPELAPRVEALIFLSHTDTTLKLSPEGRIGVITRNELARAVTNHQFTGAPTGWRAQRIDKPVASDIAQALKAIGIRPRKQKMHVGSYELGGVLQDGPGYQDREATHRGNDRIKARARTYLVPAQTSVERRQQLLRAADREASLLYDVREHPNVLTYSDYVTDAALGPTVLLEDFEDSEPLSAFLRKRPELPFEARVEIIRQVGSALVHCHRKGVVHGALNPEAILVRQRPTAQSGQGNIETRLFSFQLGHGDDVESTRHRSALAAEPASLYLAPELRIGNASATAASDIYGLGAVAHLVFTGRAPGETQQEVDAQLKTQGCIDPMLRSDSLLPQIAEWIRLTTAATPIERETDIKGWLDILELEVRELANEPTHETVDPLHAIKGDLLDGGFMVESVLGYGATARVLQVVSDDHKGSLALKVSAGEEHNERLTREGEQLALLRHQHIVPYQQTLTLRGRTCLLLGLAGETTLDRYLAQEGTISLEYASRYGEDLLSALEELEEKNVLHRDIKPANVGVRSVGKAAHHLTLFDFSLAGVPVTDIRVGTAPYRDPYLSLRGAWDHAGDRWSAAITLHEMLTGVRPAFAANHNPLDLSARVVITAERFDASVRESLTSFFEKALAPDGDHRFISANEMRRAWLRAFDAPATGKTTTTSKDTHDGVDVADELDLSDEALARIPTDALIRALPLTPRAKNALDRAGLSNAGELLQLPDNHLSLIRGIGTKVAKEILEFRRKWQDAAHLSLSVPQAPVVRGQAQAATPTTLQEWVELFFGGRKKPQQQVRALFGLEAPFAGQLDVAARDVAKHFDLLEAAGIYMSHRKCRDAWATTLPAIEVLTELCVELLTRAGGALRYDEAASALLTQLRTDAADNSAEDSALRMAQAVALFRVVADVGQDRAANANDAVSPALSFVRLRLGETRVAWFLADPAVQEPLEQLGLAADTFAARPVIAAPSEVTRGLSALVEGSLLSGIQSSRLTALAALASETAACSTALELYPRGMDKARALELCVATLVGELTPQDIERRVQGRYPEAEPLPSRPTLDGLLERFGLLWNDASQRYARPIKSSRSSVHTNFATTAGGHHATRMPLAAEPVPGAGKQLGFDEQPLPGVLPGPDVARVQVRDFEDALREALDRKQLRILSVSADRAADAALALGRRLGATPLELDQLLIREMQVILDQEGGDLDGVYAIDSEGKAAGADWFELTQLANEAADRIADRLLPPHTPLLLCQPGLIARFGLDKLVQRLVAASETPDAAAMFVLVPSVGTPVGLPTINGYRLSHLHAWQGLHVPRAWIKQASAPTAAHASS